MPVYLPGMRPRVHLIACIGTRQSEAFSFNLFRHWVRHYLGAGFRPGEFRLALFSTCEEDNLNLVSNYLSDLDIKEFSRRISQEHCCHEFELMYSTMRKGCAPDDWIVLVDADEFIDFPDTIHSFLRRIVLSDAEAVSGHLVDRFEANLGFPPVGTSCLWDQFPREIPATEELLKADPRKVCIFRNYLTISSGHHFVEESEGRKPRIFEERLRVNHFKWDSGCRRRLELTLQRFRRDPEKYPWHQEVQRALNHMADRLILP